MTNPIIANELRTRFRGRFAAVGLTVWLVAVVGIGYLTYLLGLVQISQGGFGEVGNRALAGRAVYDWLIMLVLTAVLVVVPAVAGLSVALERDRATLPLLQVSQLGAWGLVLGKWASSLLYVGVLLASAAPILAVPVLLGGVGWGDLAATLGFLLLVVVSVGAISVWTSARAKTLRGAIFGSYLWVFVLVVVTGALLLGEVLLLGDGRSNPIGPGGREFVSVWANPYVGMLSVLAEPVEASDAADLRWRTLSGAAIDFFLQRQPEQVRQQRFPDTESTRSPLWWRTVAIYLAMTPLALVGAARSVRAPGKPDRFKARHKGATS